MKDNEKGMNIEDEKFVKDLFDQDGVEVPESLSAENIMMKLSDEEPVKVTVKKRSWKKPLTAVLAVCACFLLVMVPVLNRDKADPLEESSGEAGLTSFRSYEEIKKVIESMTEAQPGLLYKSGGVEGDMAVAESADGSASAPKEAASESHSDTYLQVKGVDEADRVKCDDKYLYYISSETDKIYISSAEKGKTKRVSAIKAPKKKWFTAMFLDGDRLIAVAGGYYGSSETEVVIYDISDRKNPKKVSSYVQSGSPVSQRMADGVVYLVTDRYANVKEIPYCGNEGSVKKLSPQEICCVPDPVSPEYTVIGAVDVKSGKELSHVTKAVLGGSQDIYSNGENLYVAGLTYIKDKKEKEKKVAETEDGEMIYRFAPGYPGTSATVIIKVKMAEGNISIEKSAVVKGTIDDQFSMDEKDGNFRIATTSMDDNYEDVNNLYVLDKDLKLLGKVSGFAKGETIKAVRYVKDKAYVITYEETDPLFVIDLSDSRKPKIEGEVKIDGFSTLLVPISEDRLFGIGYDMQDVETWQETAGLKFVIFDVSDPSEPKVVTSKAMDGIYSDVQDDHRGLVVLGEGEDARYVLPCWEEFEEYAEDSDEGIEIYEHEDYRGGALEITAKDGKISVLDYHKTRDSVARCPVIEGYIYAICDNDEIEAFRMK